VLPPEACCCSRFRDWLMPPDIEYRISNADTSLIDRLLRLYSPPGPASERGVREIALQQETWVYGQVKEHRHQRSFILAP